MRETPADGEALLDLILGEFFAVPINVSAVNILHFSSFSCFFFLSVYPLLCCCCSFSLFCFGFGCVVVLFSGGK